MKYTLRQPKAFSEIGKKPNQEDFLWPLETKASALHRVFIVCDGVGGREKGEVASQTVATTLGEYLTQHWPADGVVTKETFNKALAQAYKALDIADPTGDENNTMATTMTCVVLHTNGVLLAHIGDSRIYHVRPSLANPEEERSGIIYQTEDHSLVNDLLRIGEITEEEAENFPHKNVITRAMQPHLERPYRADIINLTDVKAGDYLFLCSDGVLERLSNEQLASILSTEDIDDAEKLSAIKAICDHHTRDNYTCYLIGIDKVEEGQTLLPCPTEEDEELPDEDIEEFIEEEDDTTPPDNASEEGDEDKTRAIENEDENEEEEEEDDDDDSLMGRIRRSTRKAWRRFKAFVLKYWGIGTTRIKATKFYQRIMDTNRWHWIAGTIAFLTIYDLLLFFFGDTSYSIIYPTPKPNDSISVQEQESLIEPEVEEYEAPKPTLKDDKKKETDANTDVQTEEIAPIDEGASTPTSVSTEPITAPDPVTHTAPEIPKPTITPSSPANPAP